MKSTNLKVWLSRFWQRAYGRRTKEIATRPIEATLVMVRDDGGNLTTKIVTNENGAWKVWGEVRS